MLTPLPLIRTDSSNAFANHTLRERLPANIREISALNPDYPASIHDALKRFHDAIIADHRLSMVALPSPDYDRWAVDFPRYANDTWLNTEWFFGETLLYRRLLDCVRYFETGHDPFGAKKAEEFASDALWHTLAEALETRDMSAEDRLGALIEFDLWGNRIDLSFALVMAHGVKAGDDDLLVDDAPRVVEHLLAKPGTVHLICDNAGTELAMDCALIDGLLDHRYDVWMHVKAHPFYVSDTTVPDVHHFWRMLRARGGAEAALSERLVAAFEAGRLRVLPDYFWCSGTFLNAMPAYLHEVFAGAALVILKGDLNYRRAVTDVIWAPTTPFAYVTAYMPAPLLALRTFKSDPNVGLPPGIAEALDAQDSQWRVNGKRGVIQFKP
jgi:hypothetical protein